MKRNIVGRKITRGIDEIIVERSDLSFRVSYPPTCVLNIKLYLFALL